MAQHRHQRHDPRAAADEEQRLRRGVGVPDEVAADRPAHLEPVSRNDLVDEVGRDFTVVEPLDRQGGSFVGCRSEGIAPLRLVPVLRGEADVDVLACVMTGPAFDVEDQRSDSRRLGHRVGHLRDEPGQSPQYRCSRQGSP